MCERAPRATCERRTYAANVPLPNAASGAEWQSTARYGRNTTGIKQNTAKIQQKYSRNTVEKTPGPPEFYSKSIDFTKNALISPFVASRLPDNDER